MPDPNPAAMEFLLNRRSRPAKTLTTPVPDRAALMPILTAAARSPDHGKLEPWRFIVLERGALLRLAGQVDECGERLGKPPEDIAKARAQYTDAHLAVAVVEVQKPSGKIPLLEQTYSAGAVCLALLNAALASGWGANWLTGWAVHDRDFAETGFGLDAGERIAGLIHIGTETSAPPDRPRPNLDAITTWVSE
ncbi:nitroreductase family protein [Roseovarius sp.]|uniref:nitroreductase family protein n=1 Tax=Roseovarius sp. TaxID=1486281 RepID=UPI003BAD9154